MHPKESDSIHQLLSSETLFPINRWVVVELIRSDLQSGWVNLQVFEEGWDELNRV